MWVSLTRWWFSSMSQGEGMRPIVLAADRWTTVWRQFPNIQTTLRHFDDRNVMVYSDQRDMPRERGSQRIWFGILQVPGHQGESALEDKVCSILTPRLKLDLRQWTVGQTAYFGQARRRRHTLQRDQPSPVRGETWDNWGSSVAAREMMGVVNMPWWKLRITVEAVPASGRWKWPAGCSGLDPHTVRRSSRGSTRVEWGMRP